MQAAADQRAPKRRRRSASAKEKRASERKMVRAHMYPRPNSTPRSPSLSSFILLLFLCVQSSAAGGLSTTIHTVPCLPHRWLLRQCFCVCPSVRPSVQLVWSVSLATPRPRLQTHTHKHTPSSHTRNPKSPIILSKVTTSGPLPPRPPRPVVLPCGAAAAPRGWAAAPSAAAGGRRGRRARRRRGLAAVGAGAR